jgi:hypothetical protein
MGIANNAMPESQRIKMQLSKKQEVSLRVKGMEIYQSSL